MAEKLSIYERVAISAAKRKGKAARARSLAATVGRPASERKALAAKADKRASERSLKVLFPSKPRGTPPPPPPPPNAPCSSDGEYFVVEDSEIIKYGSMDFDELPEVGRVREGGALFGGFYHAAPNGPFFVGFIFDDKAGDIHAMTHVAMSYEDAKANLSNQIGDLLVRATKSSLVDGSYTAWIVAMAEVADADRPKRLKAGREK